MAKLSNKVLGMTAVFLIMALGLSACGGVQPSPPGQDSAEPATGATEPSQSGSEGGAEPVADVSRKETLSVVYSASTPNLQDVQLYVAQDQGIFEKYGLEVTVTLINGASPTLQALVSGQTEVAFLDPTHLLAGQGKGQDLRGIVNASHMQPYMLLSNGEVKDLQDLAGQRIGISQPGTLSQSIIQMTLEKYGIDQKDIQWVPVGGSGSRYQAMVSGRIGAGIGQVSHAIQGEGDGLKVLANLGQELPDLMGYLYVARGETFKAKESALVKFTAALLEATQLVLDDADLAAEVYMAHRSGLDKQSVSREYEILKETGAWNPRGDLRQEAVDFTAQMMIDQGHLDAVPKVEQLFAHDVLTKAVQLMEQVESHG